MNTVEGFFAVEQYTPDYVLPLLNLIRRSYGRSQWHIRWGAEEERHADLWRNTVLALRRRSEPWLDDYTAGLRSRVRGFALWRLGSEDRSLWNVWDQVNHARALIAEAGPLEVADLREQLSG